MEGQTMKRTTGQPVIARILEVAFLLVLPFLLHYLFPVMILIAWPYTYLGPILILGGLALQSWASIIFRKVGTSFQLHGKSPLLVTTGPFQFSRNPMYLGMLFWLIGLSVLLGSLSVFLLPILFFLVANFYMVPLEEKSMERTFETQFNTYKQRVRRWF
jgi:protein-S-isoprenylcysteine O-methyltransferase Ste14